MHSSTFFASEGAVFAPITTTFFLFYGVYFAVFISGQAIVLVYLFSSARKPLVSVCVCVCNFVCVVQDKLREYLKYNVRVTYPGNLKIKQKKRQEKREQNGSFSSFFFVVVVVIVFFYAFNLLPIILLFTA